MPLFPLLFLLTLPALSQPTVSDLLEQKTLSRLHTLNDTLDGVLAYHAIDLTTGRTLSRHPDVVFPQASSIKIPILIELFRQARAGKLHLDTRVNLSAADRVGGSGTLQETLAKSPISLTWRELATAMVEHSDNTATNRIIAEVGMESVNRTLDQLGLRQTRLRRVMMDTPAAQRNDENVSTPAEMADLVARLFRGQVVDAAACDEMLGMMKLVKAGMRKAVPAAVPVASKPGEVSGVRAETGLVYLEGRPFVLSVMSTYLAGDPDPVESVTRLVFSHFERLARSNRYGHRVQ